MGMAVLFFETHPPYFQNQCDFCRSTNDITMIFIYFFWFQISKKSVWVWDPGVKESLTKLSLTSKKIWMKSWKTSNWGDLRKVQKIKKKHPVDIIVLALHCSGKLFLMYFWFQITSVKQDSRHLSPKAPKNFSEKLKITLGTLMNSTEVQGTPRSSKELWGTQENS